MRSAWLTAGSSILLASLLTQSIAFAAIFPDVPDSHIYRQPIEHLVGLKVINGNPDGTFRPERAVNRAEMLTMLYRALGLTPELAGSNCFPDVLRGSWYEAVVCDAAAQRIVDGYSDGTFRPEREVNRVEALKMIMNMFEFNVGELSEQMRNVVKFVDVSLSAWYTKYLYAAFTQGILPIAGQVGPRFYPDAPLLRGEAATYIYNALLIREPAEEEAQEEEMMEDEENLGSGDQSTESETEPIVPTGPVIKEIDFPFSDSGNFSGKRSMSYRFMLKGNALADFSVRLGGSSGSVTCRLFKLSEQGLSAEYYLGLQTDQNCWIKSALGPGSYQLDVQPSIADAGFSLATKTAKGDGNDGFREAKTLLVRSPRSALLEVDDFADWYTFKVTKESNMTISLSANPQTRVLVYPMEDVDLYGFAGPLVNEMYSYPAGTYYVGVFRDDPAFGRLTYTIQLK